MFENFSEKTKQLMQLHYSRLSEKDRRQYAALESLKLGRGGVNYISEVLMLSKKTLWQGRQELLGKAEVVLEGQRRKGGGRKKNGKISRDQRFVIGLAGEL